MVSFLSALKQILKDILDSFSDRPTKILMLGLDSAGKTTVLYMYKLKELITTISTVPTIGFHVVTVQLRWNVSFTVWDVGGQGQIRVLGEHCFKGCDGLIYVVDSANCTRFAEARNELDWILGSDEMSGVPLVVITNIKISRRKPHLLKLPTISAYQRYMGGSGMCKVPVLPSERDCLRGCKNLVDL